MSDTTTTSYKPGDIANGHILSNDGQWLPVGGPTAPVGEGPKKPIYQRWWFITAGVLVALMIIGSASGGEEPATADETAASAPAEPKAKPTPTPAPKPESTPEPAPEPEAMNVSAVQVLKEFKGNEAAADIKYQGETLKVTGTAIKVDTEIFDDEQYVIQINGGGAWDILTVNCNDVTASEAATVKVDGQVTVIGTFDDGGDLGVELKDCALA
jgi:pyruvate/2-oxoglutarate dehydrogenase complex dihydrolipoamide acyltransferase (E2) component